MHTLKFKSKEFRRMLNFMIMHERRKPYTNEKTDQYGLWLVKDEGIYLMSPTSERDLVNDKSSHIIYAQGYSPKAKYLWEKTHMVSGDDFAEFIPVSEKAIDLLIKGGDIKVKLTEKDITVTCTGKR